MDRRNYIDLIEALRGTPTRSKRLLLQEAADTIEALIEDLKATGRHYPLCDLCVHRQDLALCAPYCWDCATCSFECSCKTCRDSSCFVWRGRDGKE